MSDIWVAIGTVAAAMFAMLGLVHTIYTKPHREKFNMLFKRMTSCEKAIAVIPTMQEDIREIKRDVHELASQYTTLAQCIARIEGKLGCGERK